MTNNVKMSFINSVEDLLHVQHFIQVDDNHHLNANQIPWLCGICFLVYPRTFCCSSKVKIHTVLPIDSYPLNFNYKRTRLEVKQKRLN